MLRKALGDGDFIETVPKRGYRFVGQVTGPPASDGVPLAAVPSATASSHMVAKLPSEARRPLPAPAPIRHPVPVEEAGVGGRL